MKKGFDLGQDPKTKSLKQVLGQLTWKANFLLPFLSLVLLSTFALPVSYQSQVVICGLAESQLERISLPISRELALGEETTAKEIFEEFRDTLKKRGIKADLHLIPTHDKSDLGLKPSCQPKIFNGIVSHPVIFGGEKLGTIQGNVSYNYNSLFLIFPILLIFLIIFSVRLLTRQIIYSTRKLIVEPIINISSGIPLKNEQRGVLEIFHIEQNIEELKERVSAQAKMDIESQKAIQLSKFASQVAHDIRSPLTALEMFTRTAKDISSEEGRVIIRSSVGRIRDIANSLIIKHKEILQGPILEASSPATDEPKSIQLLSSMMDVLITEKRMQYRSRMGIEVEFEMNKESYGLFAEIQPIEFKRVISNLVNNSVEALGDKGRVKVYFSPGDKSGQILLIVEDNGKGISPERLTLLGRGGTSFGKEGGLGLGLQHAYSSVEKWGGSLKIESKVGIGTKVLITLPQASIPKWFVPVLKITNNTTVVILDDDSSIHQIWRGRFESKNLAPNLIHFSTPEDLISWHRRYSEEITSPIVYLCDYELIGSSKNGLDTIQEIGVAAKSYLVTSRFEEPKILELCEKLNVRLIPKSMASFVSIELEDMLDNNDIKNDPEIFNYVYIEDDNILRMAWEKRAKRHNINLLTLKSTSDFRFHQNQIDKENTSIYIDSNLGEGEMPGEDFSKILYQDGYKKLFISSGYGEEKFAHLPWLKYAGKECPF